VLLSGTQASSLSVPPRLSHVAQTLEPLDRCRLVSDRNLEGIFRIPIWMSAFGEMGAEPQVVDRGQQERRAKDALNSCRAI
jgi:hypothetical protein